MSIINSGSSFHTGILNSLFPSFIHHSGATLTRQNAVHVARANLLGGPATPNPAWEVMFQRWKPIIHLLGGTLAMREAGTEYLPQEEGEEKHIYLNRLTRAVLYGAYSRTVKTLAGLPFMNPLHVNDMPTELEYLLTDADGEGQSLNAFAKQILLDLINYGKAHILVEYPSVQGSLSLAEERDMNIRPYLCRVDPVKAIGWKYTTVGSKRLLDEFRIFEDVEVEDPSNPWGVVHERHVRSITRDAVTVYKINSSETDSKSAFEVVDEVPNDLGRVNVVTIYGNKTGFMQGAPVLEELAWLNIRHYQKVSDLDNIEHICNVPMAYALGVDEEEAEDLVFSPHTMIKSGNENMKLGYLEHSGNAIPASQDSIKDLEMRMVAMGADMLAPRGTSTRETGIAKTIDNTKATSVLQELVEALEIGIEESIQLAAEWLDLEESEAQVNIGDKISLTVDANLVTNLIDLARSGNMTFEQLTMELQKRNLISESTQLQEAELPEEPSQAPTAEE